MAPLAQDILILKGHLAPTASATAGFTRLYGASKQQYIELNQLDITPGSGPFNDGAIATYEIKVESRLVPDGYPSPAGVPPVGPKKRELLKPIPHPVPGQFRGSDGSALTVVKDQASGQITGFNGTSKNNVQYNLSIKPSVIKAPGRDAPPVQWYNATMSITTGKDPDALNFGFSYCPWANLLDLFLWRKNVDTTIRIDLVPKPTEQQLKAQPGLIPSMNAGRGIAVDGYLYSSQIITVDDTQIDPQIYLPVIATFWPYLDGLAYFATAIGSMATSTTSGLPGVQIPISNFANLSVTFPTTQQNFVDTVVAAIGPALGPFLASFISRNEAQAAPLSDAILWLAGMSIRGIGRPDFLQELAYFYNQVENWIREGKEGSGGGSAPLHVRGLTWTENYAQPHTSKSEFH